VAVGGAGGSGQSAGGGGGAGLGGGLFVAAGADVTLNAVTFANDAAMGGAGGARTSASANGGFGGGGGLGGAGGTGGATNTYGGGGGIGLTATGSALGSGANGGAGIVSGSQNAGNGNGIGLNSNGGAAGGGGGGGSRLGGGGGGGIGGGAGQVAGAAGTGGLGGFGGGGGGGFNVGGAGGFGGGGGAGYYSGGAGGFGGGGGGFLGGGDGQFAIGGGAGGFGGGNGGAGTPQSGGDSGGGLGAGGAIFVQQGGTVVIQGGTESGGSVAGGAAGGSTGTAGSAFGAGIFLQGNETLILAPLAGQTLAIADVIADQTGSGGTGANAGAGRIVVQGAGSVTLSAANTFTGGIDLAGGTLVLANAAAAGSGAIAFTGAATLEIGAFIPSNSITGFAAGDTVDFIAIAPTALSVINNGTDTVLSVINNGTDTMIGGVTFSGVYSTTSTTPASRLVLSSDGAGGTRVTVACFAAGTRILTQAGEVAVETLRPGQNVATRHGLRPVRWVGRRRVDLSRHSCPALAMPIRVAAGAMAPGVPHRDLWLSGDHAVLADGALIPIRYLANGASIARDDWPEVTYFHVELDHHDILYAEGLPAESYLDTGNRADFEGEAALTLHPDMTVKTWRAHGCAPLLTDGPALAAAHALLLRRAEALGWAPTCDPNLRVLADGREIQAQSDVYPIPPGTSWLRLLSRSVVPQERDASSEDRRRLGVAVAELCFDGMAAPDDAIGPGFYAAEPDWRWTNGDGWLSVPAGARCMSLRLVPIETYRAHRDIDDTTQAASRDSMTR
jgi:Hint domain